MTWALLCYPELKTRHESVRALVAEAYRLGSSVFGAATAQEWANGFIIPPADIARDTSEFARVKGDFLLMVDTRLALLHPQRLNRERIMRLVSADNPDRDRLLRLAEVGIELLPDPGYRGCDAGKRPRLSRSFLEASTAVEKMFYSDFLSEGLAIILTEPEVAALPKLGLCLAGWAKKLGKECGRPITNGSGRRSMPPSQYLNSPHTKQAAVALYGEIKHPVIGDVPRMIMELQEQRGFHRDDIRIWKFDLRKAYNLLTYAREAVAHLGVELTEGNFLFFLAGVFGLTGMPYAFQVVTRVLVFELRKRIRGLLIMYVDDGLGVCHWQDLEHDKNVTFQFITGLLGNKAIEESKTAFGTTLDFIGYEVRLSEGLVTIARKNLLKALYAFLNVDIDGSEPVPVRALQGLASLASRYGYISSLMRPFTRLLYSSFRRHHHAASVVLKPRTRRVIRLFRFLFAMVALHGSHFSRTFESFARRQHKYICEYDASLTGIGIIWFEVGALGDERAMAYASISTECLRLEGDPSFQNTSEYIGALFAALGMERMGLGSEPTCHRGDSISALTWTQKGTVRSDVAIPAAFLWALLVHSSQTDVVLVDHVGHARASRVDILSRSGTWAQVLADDRAKYGGLLPLQLPRLEFDSDLILRLCDPRKDIDSDLQFSAFFKEGLQHIKRIGPQ